MFLLTGTSGICIDGVLRQLEYLDLTGVLVIDRYSIDEHITLPERLKILRLKDTGRLFDSLHESISKHHSLAVLDISLCRFKLEALDTISVTLVHLTSLNMVGMYNLLRSHPVDCATNDAEALSISFVTGILYTDCRNIYYVSQNPLCIVMFLCLAEKGKIKTCWAVPCGFSMM